MLKNSKVVYFRHLKKLVRPETFGPYYVKRLANNALGKGWHQAVRKSYNLLAVGR